MKVVELLKLLSRTELSNLKYIDDTQQCGIREEDQGLIVLLLEEALDKLYGSFYLKEDSIYLEPVDGKVIYDITSEHLMEKGLQADYDHYLWKPHGKSFNDDIIRIIRIIDSTGRELPLNNPEKSTSVYTPLYNRIELSDLNSELELEIIYAAKHSKLSLKENTSIDLPISLIPAIRAYVAYLVHSNMNTENAVQNAQKYLSQFNLIITENIQSDVAFVKTEDRTCKFTLGGWV